MGFVSPKLHEPYSCLLSICEMPGVRINAGFILLILLLLRYIYINQFYSISNFSFPSALEVSPLIRVTKIFVKINCSFIGLVFKLVS